MLKTFDFNPGGRAGATTAALLIIPFRLLPRLSVSRIIMENVSPRNSEISVDRGDAKKYKPLGFVAQNVRVQAVLPTLPLIDRFSATTAPRGT